MGSSLVVSTAMKLVAKPLDFVAKGVKLRAPVGIPGQLALSFGLLLLKGMNHFTVDCYMVSNYDLFLFTACDEIFQTGA
jgi:hypothetical protein